MKFIETIKEKASAIISEKATTAMTQEVQTQLIESIPIVAGLAITALIFVSMRNEGRKAASKAASGTITIINNYYYGHKELGSDISDLTQAICDIASKIVETSVK